MIQPEWTVGRASGEVTSYFVQMNSVALVTGGSRGIGLGIARALASAGFDLAINGVRPEPEVAAALGSLRSSGREVIYCRGSVGIDRDRTEVLSHVRSHFGRLHVLVNNAGVAPRERMDILEATEESYDRVMRVNLQGPYFLTQAAARWMIAQKQDSPESFFAIINVGSISATVVSTNRGEYCLSKAGVAMATELWATRLAEFDIPVYELRPGVISTDMTVGAREKYDRLIADGLSPQRRWGTPDDVGKAAAALATGAFSFSTGQVVMVDGGLTIPRL